MLTELRCPPEVIVTSKDNAKGHAFAVVDYGPEANLIWVVILNNGECWSVPNPEIRFTSNWTLGRRFKPQEKT